MQALQDDNHSDHYSASNSLSNNVKSFHTQNDAKSARSSSKSSNRGRNKVQDIIPMQRRKRKPVKVTKIRSSTSKTLRTWPKYKHGKHPARYFMGVIYCLLQLFLGLSYAPLTPISETVSKAFDCSLQLINLTSASFFVSSIIFLYPSVELIRRTSLSTAVKTASFFLLVGFILKMLIKESVWWVVIGQFVIGSTSMVFENIKAKFVTDWFEGDEVNGKTLLLLFLMF